MRAGGGRRSEIEAFMDAAIAHHGGLDVLVNNAGIAGPTKPVEEVTPEELDAVLQIDLAAMFHCARRAVPALRAAGGGSIVNLSSSAWVRGASIMVPYVAAKAGVIGLTNSLGTALGPDRIRVNAIAPGAVMTPRQMALWHTPETRAWLVGLQAIPDDVTERDVAAAALFLAADDSHMITRQCLFVDGGLR